VELFLGHGVDLVIVKEAPNLVQFGYENADAPVTYSPDSGFQGKSGGTLVAKAQQDLGMLR
jgi:hypothetical protein